MMEYIGIAGQGAASAGVLLAGLLSAALYGRKRHWIEALLALVAALALAALLAGPSRPAAEAGALALQTESPAGPASDDALARSLLHIPQAGSIVLDGHGLREAQWRDLPARPLRWNEPQADLLRLDFPRTLPLGRSFTLTVRRAQPQAGWRLQLLAENGQVLAESSAKTAAAALSLQWLPPLAETLTLQARLLDVAGKTIAQGPVPLQVTDALSLQLQGRFNAPSFDARSLNQLLADSNAILDWQVTLGKGIARSETARAPLTAPNALFVDAAHFEKLNASVRAALLAQVGQGMPLVVLAANAADSGLWQRELGLRLQAQSATTEKEDVRLIDAGGEQLALAPVALNPAARPGEAWTVLAADSKRQPWLWQRNWKQGRIVWIGVSDWHRYAIASPAALGQWWQSLFDLAVAGSVQKVAWRQPDPMPLPGLRTEICAAGVAPGSTLQVDGQPALAWQSRTDKADVVCAAFLPAKAGWLSVRSGEHQRRLYVYDSAAWPAWQKALRHDATVRYAARAPETVADSRRVPLPAWPFALVFALAMLALWWRERR